VQPLQPLQHTQPAADPATQQMLEASIYILIGIQRDLARYVEGLARNVGIIVEVLEARLPQLPPARQVEPQCASFMWPSTSDDV
jgi:hypothetical protein